MMPSSAAISSVRSTSLFLNCSRSLKVLVGGRYWNTYALGRPVQYVDMPTVRSIVRDAGSKEYKFSSIVLGIVNSTPFQKRTKMTQELEQPAVRTAER